jgi:hypothetical protein
MRSRLAPPWKSLSSSSPFLSALVIWPMTPRRSASASSATGSAFSPSFSSAWLAFSKTFGTYFLATLRPPSMAPPPKPPRSAPFPASASAASAVNGLFSSTSSESLSPTA